MYSEAEVRHERLLNGESANPGIHITLPPAVTAEQARQRLEYGPCAKSTDSYHTWSMCFHPAMEFSHAACVFCHTDY